MGLFSRSDDYQTRSASAAGADAAVTIYTTSWCGSCMMAKRYLQQKNVPYKEIDIDRVAGAAEFVMSKARGYKTVPTMVIGDSIVVDWDRRGLDDALKAEGVL